MAVLIPVAGGKGGVGKSVLSLNLAVTLAQQCKKTILVDLDLGGANLHTLLGLKNNQAGIGTFITKQETDFSNLLQATGIPNLQFIAGDCLYPGVANMDFFTKCKILRNIQALDADYIILDLGAGSTYNIVDFFITTNDGIIVVTPELTSILNAYSFLKTTVFRLLYRTFPSKSPERQILQNSVLQRMEGKEYSFEQILSVIGATFPESAELALNQLKSFKPRIIMNMGRQGDDAVLGNRLLTLSRNKLSINPEVIGFVPYDQNIGISIARRQPLCLLNPGSAFSQALPAVVKRIEAASDHTDMRLEEALENFEEIIKSYYEHQERDR
ncbi:MAG: P-loop NTPase [Treponema sp.]|nr:P-loop NTPase [Candidatus Treponema caballi]